MSPHTTAPAATRSVRALRIGLAVHAVIGACIGLYAMYVVFARSPHWPEARVALSPDGRMMARRYDEKLSLLDLSSRAVQDVGRGFGADFSPDGRHVAIPGYPVDRILALPTLEEVLAFRDVEPISFVFSRDGRKVALLGKESVHICDLATKSLDSTLPTHLDNVTDDYTSSDVEFTPDGSRVATAGSDRYTYWVVIWDVATEQHLVQLKDHGGWVRIAISPDCKLLVLESTSSQRPRVRVHNTQDGALIGELNGLAAPVGAMAFAPGDSTLALGMYNGTVELWDAATRSRTKILAIGEDSIIQAVAFSADGREVLGATRDGVVYVWDVASGINVRRVTMPRSGWETGSSHWLTLTLLAAFWLGTWVFARSRVALPPRLAQATPGYGGLIVAGVVVAWQVLCFAVLFSESGMLRDVGWLLVMDMLLVAAVAITGVSWLAAGIRFSRRIWLASSIVGIGGVIILGDLFARAVASV